MVDPLPLLVGEGNQLGAAPDHVREVCLWLEVAQHRIHFRVPLADRRRQGQDQAALGLAHDLSQHSGVPQGAEEAARVFSITHGGQLAVVAHQHQHPAHGLHAAHHPARDHAGFVDDEHVGPVLLTLWQEGGTCLLHVAGAGDEAGLHTWAGLAFQDVELAKEGRGIQALALQHLGCLVRGSADVHFLPREGILEGSDQGGFPGPCRAGKGDKRFSLVDGGKQLLQCLRLGRRQIHSYLTGRRPK